MAVCYTDAALNNLGRELFRFAWETQRNFFSLKMRILNSKNRKLYYNGQRGFPDPLYESFYKCFGEKRHSQPWIIYILKIFNSKEHRIIKKRKTFLLYFQVFHAYQIFKLNLILVSNICKCETGLVLLQKNTIAMSSLLKIN